MRRRSSSVRDGGFSELTIQLVPGQESAIEDRARLFHAV